MQRRQQELFGDLATPALGSAAKKNRIKHFYSRNQATATETAKKKFEK